MAEPHSTKGAPPRQVRVTKNRQPGWLKALAWLALIAGILALLVGLGRCNRNEVVTPAPIATSDNAVVAATPNAGSAAALASISTLGGYLAGTDPAPRSFQFEKLNFDTAKSDIRAVDAAEIDQIGGVLKQSDTTKVRIAGYADARGSTAANIAVGKARADAVKNALVGKGVAADRIETVSGGESDPVDNNTTVSGQAENRRTELVVTKR